jgi:hypothetical protein
MRSTHRPDWAVTNEQAVRTDLESDDRTAHERDGRTFDQQPLEAIRMMAVERVREGENAADVIASYGFNRTTIYRWFNAAGRLCRLTGNSSFSAGRMARTRGSVLVLHL